MMLVWPSVCLLSAASAVSAALAWNDTQYVFAFGDSYTSDGFNISAGVDSPVPGTTWSNGPIWVQSLGDTYNVTDTKVFNLASGGATIDAALVPPYSPTVLSIVDQVSQFHDILAPKPAGARWDSADSLFAIWIGINDVANSFPWTNVTSVHDFHHVLMQRLFSQVEILYQDGARSFLFLTLPPIDRTPSVIEQGAQTVSALKPRLGDYNSQLVAAVDAFAAAHPDVNRATVFDTRPLFNTLLDSPDTFGFVNVTGFCEAYMNGTPNKTTQIPPCAPVSSYFWLSPLHPLYTVHNLLAHAISTTLST
ncbi:hypothetical protein BD413DRAFT_4268 [Trametes elegans]|nr:hypothetical protein BD413DRAFT_4268 [Trametes elegans]